jgi:hypothetical protein
MRARLRDLHRLAKFKAEQRDKRRRRTSTSEASLHGNDSPVHSTLWPGFTWQQARQAQALLGRCNQRWGRLRGARYAARIAAIRGVVLRGLVGNSSWGWSMHGKRGGQAMARHALYKLREISPFGVRASVIARDRRKAREAFEREQRPGSPEAIVSRIISASVSVLAQRRTSESH